MACTSISTPEVNPILADDDFGNCLLRAQQFSAFLLSYAEGLNDDAPFDGENEGLAMGVRLLHDALKKLNERREADVASIANDAMAIARNRAGQQDQ